MPTYEYRCNECAHEMETFQPITAKALTKCPACGRNALERLISGGGAVLFKGSGFYETDYRSNDYKKKAEAESKSTQGKPEAGSGGSGSAEAKGGGEPAARMTAESKAERSSGTPASDTKPAKASGGSSRAKRAKGE